MRSLALDSDQGPQPAWAGALLKIAGGPLDFVESMPSPTDPSVPARWLQSSFVLEARRITHHRNRWYTVELDRFRLLDRSTGGVMAEGDEIWIRAGRATYHCGLGSGLRPTVTTQWPAGDGVARFIRAAMAGRGDS